MVRPGKSETIRVEPADVPAHVFANFALQLAHVADCVRQNRCPLDFRAGLARECAHP